MGANRLGDFARFFKRCFGQNHTKFISAKTKYEGIFPTYSFNITSGFDDHLVSRRVTVCVVIWLESINISINKSYLRAFFNCAL